MDLEYDYARRRVLAATNTALHALDSSASAWSAVAVAPPGQFALDRRSDRPVSYRNASSGEGTGFYDLVNDAWQFRFSIGNGYQPLTSIVGDSVLLVPGGPTPLWERRGNSIELIDTRPGGGVAARPVRGTRGRVLVPVRGTSSGLVLARQLTSSTPDESCTAGEDLDFDGASGCDDPDCWEICFPACPLATTSCL